MATSAAQRALRHPVQVRLNALYNALSRIPGGGAGDVAIAATQDGGQELTLDVSTAEIEDYTRLIAEATEAVAVSISGVSPVTVTDSAMPPTCRLTS